MSKYRHNVTRDMLDAGILLLAKLELEGKNPTEEDVDDSLEKLFEAMLNTAPDELVERWAGERKP